MAARTATFGKESRSRTPRASSEMTHCMSPTSTTTDGSTCSKEELIQRLQEEKHAQAIQIALLKAQVADAYQPRPQALNTYCSYARPPPCYAKPTLEGESTSEPVTPQQTLKLTSGSSREMLQSSELTVAASFPSKARRGESKTRANLAKHYATQGSASYRSRSDRFGTGLDQAALGVRANANAAMGAEQPRMPCPGTYDADRDAKGRFSSIAKSSASVWHMPAPPSPKELRYLRCTYGHG